MNTEGIIERIVENRLQYKFLLNLFINFYLYSLKFFRYLEIYNKKAKKQQDYYDTTERKV